MRTILGLSALVLMAAPALAQPRYDAPPRGSYERQCTNIRMNGQFLSAYCRGARGSGESSINVMSCSTDIGVDANGGLTCIGPGGGAPPAVRDAPPGYATDERPPYDRPGYGYGDRRRSAREMATLYELPGFRGRPVRVFGPTANLEASGLNDRVRSIQLDPRSGPWLVCTDANYGGRCVTIRRSLSNTRALGISESISSLRPVR